MRRKDGRTEGWKLCWAAVGCLLTLSVLPSFRLSAQDTSAIDRGVRIGIVYRPGVRPGVVLLPERSAALDSARAILARDLDYSDRFEIITLPGGDSIRVSAPAPGPRPGAGARARTGGEAAGLNFSPYPGVGAGVAHWRA